MDGMNFSPNAHTSVRLNTAAAVVSNWRGKRKLAQRLPFHRDTWVVVATVSPKTQTLVAELALITVGGISGPRPGGGGIVRHPAPAQCSTSVLSEVAHCCGQRSPTAQTSRAPAAATLTISLEPPPGWPMPGSDGRACTTRHPGETPAACPALPRPAGPA